MATRIASGGRLPEKPPAARSSGAQRNFARQLEAVRMAVAEARAIADETAGDDDVMRIALARMVQSHLFLILQKLIEAQSARKASLPDIHAIGRTLCALNKQELEMERWRAEARSRVGAGVNAAAAQVEQARAAGLTIEAADKIRNALLEIKL
jgi:hypothetical protein